LGSYYTVGASPTVFLSKKKAKEWLLSLPTDYC
jgi:hypothetical protein